MICQESVNNITSLLANVHEQNNRLHCVHVPLNSSLLTNLKFWETADLLLVHFVNKVMFSTKFVAEGMTSCNESKFCKVLHLFFKVLQWSHWAFKPCETTLLTLRASVGFSSNRPCRPCWLPAGGSRDSMAVSSESCWDTWTSNSDW